MATSRLIEFETGTSTKRRHSHNDYYGGDFWTPRHRTQQSPPNLIQPEKELP